MIVARRRRPSSDKYPTRDYGEPWGIDPSFPCSPTPGEYMVGTVVVQPETGLTIVAAKRLVRACHISYTPQEWEAVIANRWHEAIDIRNRVAYRCTGDLAEQQGAFLRVAGQEVRWLWIGVMHRDDLGGV